MIKNKNNFNEDEQCNIHLDFPTIKEKMWYAFLQEKTIIINGDINDDLIEKAVIQIYNFNDVDDYNESQSKYYERTPIKIYINSFGGSIDEAFSLISAIETSKTPIITIALGKAISVGFLILLAGHRRYAQRFSTLMYHQGSTFLSGEINKMMEYTKYWEDCQNKIENYVIKQTKIKKKKLEEIFLRKQDWFMDAEEAIELGIIHGIWEGKIN